MMIVCKGSNTEIKFDSCNFHTLVIENKELLRNVTYSFYSETADDCFVFSKDYKPFEFCKKGVFIPSVIGLDMGNKRLMTKINADLEHLIADELYSEFLDVKSRLVLLAEMLIQKSDFSLEYSDDISPRDIIKLYGLSLVREDGAFAESFIRYIQLLKQYLDASLIVVSDLHCFFSTEELDLIFETLILSDIRLLSIEGIQPTPSKYERLHIIDSELCEIE